MQVGKLSNANTKKHVSLNYDNNKNECKKKLYEHNNNLLERNEKSLLF